MPAIQPCSRRLFVASWLLAGLLGLGGCATPPTSSRDPHATTRQRILGVAERMVGTPYVLGGESPGGVDCSGLVQYTYQQAGIRVPRTTAAQFQAATIPAPGVAGRFAVLPHRWQQPGVPCRDLRG